MPRMMSMSPVYPHRIIRSKAGNDTFGTRTSHQGFFLPISLCCVTKYHTCANSRPFVNGTIIERVIKETHPYLPFTEISSNQHREKGHEVSRTSGTVKDLEPGTFKDPNPVAVMDPFSGTVKDPEQGTVRDPKQGTLMDFEQGTFMDMDPKTVADP
jgi:hypothetical protein